MINRVQKTDLIRLRAALRKITAVPVSSCAVHLQKNTAFPSVYFAVEG